MKILKRGITEIYDYTCEEIRERTCPICKTVYEYTDSECEIVTADNPNYDREYRQWCNSFQNYSVYAIPYLKNLARNPTGFRRWDEWLGVIE